MPRTFIATLGPQPPSQTLCQVTGYLSFLTRRLVGMTLTNDSIFLQAGRHDWRNILERI